MLQSLAMKSFSSSTTAELEKMRIEENEKKHKEMNKKFQDYKLNHQFDLEKPSHLASKFTTESQKKKEIKELKALFEIFQTSMKDEFKNFDEKAFMYFISKITHTHDNTIVIDDPKFEEMIKKLAIKINMFKDFKHSCFFICFCSISKLNYAEIWDCFTSYILNNQDKMQVELKCMLLFNYSPINEKRNILNI